MDSESVRVVEHPLLQELLIEPNDFFEKFPQLVVISQVLGHPALELWRNVVRSCLSWSERHGEVIGWSVPNVVGAMTACLAALLVPLDQAAAQDSDAIVVTQATATKYNLKSIADLAAPAS